jgi:hypothetical protein
VTQAAETPEVLTLQQIRSTADVLERQVLATRRLTEEKVEARRPGGAKFPEDTAASWLAYAIWLGEQLGGATTDSTQRPLAQVMHEALADTPIVLDLSGGERVAVHPKSLDALLMLEALDAGIEQLLKDMAVVLAVETSELSEDDAIAWNKQRAAAQLSAAMLKRKSLQLFVWILIHEGPGLPFSETDADPDAPPVVKTLTGDDLAAIVTAHLMVNRRDIDFLAAAFPADRDGERSRLPLSGWLGASASEAGAASRQLMRERTLRSEIAKGVAAAEVMRAAQARAKTDRG